MANEVFNKFTASAGGFRRQASALATSVSNVASGWPSPALIGYQAGIAGAFE